MNLQKGKNSFSSLLFKSLRKGLLLVFLWASVFYFFYLLANIYSLYRETGYKLNAAQRTNFLLFGIGGDGHEGKDLADTIMFVSIDNKSGDTALFSIPRDLWVSSIRAKINTVYHYGETESSGYGLVYSKSVVSETIGQPINFSALINFDGLKEIVDAMGGVQVNVENAFDDYRYPIAGKENDPCDGDKAFKCRYEHIHFDAGPQIMNGEVALKYARSRYAVGDEGTDFSRAKRQQKLLLAIRAKAFSARFLTKPGNIKSLMAIIRKNVVTDIQVSDYAFLARLGGKVKLSTIRSGILDEGTKEKPGYLIQAPISEKYDYQWVLVPRESWQVLKKYVQDFLDGKTT